MFFRINSVLEIKKNVSISRDRTGFHQIPETALVTDISEKQCFLGSAMPWENTQISFPEWQLDPQSY